MQHATPHSTGMRPPWSPLSITLISLLLPAGGAILTIRNMQRLNAIDSKGARELTFAAIGVFAVGIAVLFIVAGRATAASGATGDTGAFLGFGTAMASYIVQQRPFQAWRTANRAAYTSGWPAALGTAVVYTVITLLAALPVLGLATAVELIGGGTGAL